MSQASGQFMPKVIRNRSAEEMGIPRRLLLRIEPVEKADVEERKRDVSDQTVT
jgi:hypothetical protein